MRTISFISTAAKNTAGRFRLQSGRVTAVTVVTVILGYPAAVIPAGEHPVNAKCRRRIYPPFSACKTTPAVRKILPIFPTAFTGCNTLHFALQSRVPDVPSGLPYGRSYALLILRSTLRIKEWQHDGDGSCEGVFQKHRHHRHDRHAGNKGDS